MYSSRVSMAIAGNMIEETNIKIAFILATIINKEIT